MGIFFCILFGVLCAIIASKKGRSIPGWFFCGFFITVIGLVILLCLSNRNEEENHRNMAAMENQRLREQLRQERIKGEAFREHTVARLDVQDNQLGVDTRAAQSLTHQSAGTPGLLGMENVVINQGDAPLGAS